MRAGVETIRIMEEDQLLDHVTKVGAHLHAALHRELDAVKGVKQIRGQGLMIGIDLDRSCGTLMQRALDAGLLLSVTADSVVRLVPPLIITEAEADEVVAILVPLIKTFLAEAA
jgi:acetylornithine aminotransferase